MFNIDEDMMKLAKMQERLIKATETNREENLNVYMNTVTQIDLKAFAGILEELEHVDQHNSTLEEELVFLTKLKSSYDHLNELQLGFINVCQTYGNKKLKLSDISQINIDYIVNRINAIEGYLLNLRNIDLNKEKLQELDKQFAIEIKKSNFLSSKFEQLERALVDSFERAEGRLLVNDRDLKYTSVVDEYKNNGMDFRLLISDSKTLDTMLSKAMDDVNEINDKYRTAEFCYNNVPNFESKQILSEVNIELLSAKYKLVLLKILRLLSNVCTEYDKFKQKREDLIKLIEYRSSYLKSLGISFSIDPFKRNDINSQLNFLLGEKDNSKLIRNLGIDIGLLSSRIEEMRSQNDEYSRILGKKEELFTSKMSVSDVDVSMVELPTEEDFLLHTSVSDEVLENQVVSVRNIGLDFNISIVEQKTSSVIRRVNQMVNTPVDDVKKDEKEQVVSDVPELVIMPAVSVVDNEDMFEEISFSDDIFTNDSVEEDVETLEDNEEIVSSSIETVDAQVSDGSLFETMVPFDEPLMFDDKLEGSLESEKIDSDSLSLTELQAIANKSSEDVQFLYNDEEVMPEAFWVTEPVSGSTNNEEQEEVISFDQQIDMLLADQSNVKTKKLEVPKNKGMAA